MSSCDDNTFLRFLETCLHPLVVRDDVEAKALAISFNELLKRDGYLLVVAERVSERAIYKASVQRTDATLAVANTAQNSCPKIVKRHNPSVVARLQVVVNHGKARETGLDLLATRGLFRNVPKLRHKVHEGGSLTSWTLQRLPRSTGGEPPESWSIGRVRETTGPSASNLHGTQAAEPDRRSFATRRTNREPQYRRDWHNAPDIRCTTSSSY